MAIKGAESYAVEYMYNDKNQLLAEEATKDSLVATTSYAYDANGNQIIKTKEETGTDDAAGVSVSANAEQMMIKAEKYYDIYKEIGKLEPDKDQYGNAVDGSLRNKKAKLLSSKDLTEAQQALLYGHFIYSDTANKYVAIGRATGLSPERMLLNLHSLMRKLYHHQQTYTIAEESNINFSQFLKTPLKEYLHLQDR